MTLPDECVFNGCLISFTSIKLRDITLGCKGDGEELCCTSKCCLAINEKPYPIGLDVPKSCSTRPGTKLCGFSLFLCEYGVKVPTVLCKSEHHCFCFRNGAAFPFADPVPEPVCAIAFCRLVPCKPACLVPPFGGKGVISVGAPAKQEMER
eukprot:CAMPEP_0119319144 /NCGR_PEP_ID=MMETSP1333-20130426/48596_1 /TAXON_ID=418940 /ORGANISM="Scyphosphaera apsteinii, Strain RCC1455" /LENGTH=150 /DNA_ID=CAMNT_0007325485 /DNA_START=77 /DNA_END=529 /DNA_ORIENTATION=+